MPTDENTHSTTECFALFLWTETPLHAGAGSTLTAIDLPIQREIHTQHPVVWASGVKGALRELAGGGKKELSEPMEVIFGPDTAHASVHGGLAMFSEARVLLFPVAETSGVFAWVTCPMVLARLSRDLGTMQGVASGAENAEVAAFLKLPVPKMTGSEVAFSGGGVRKLHFDAGASLTVAADEATAEAKFIAEWLAKNALPAGEGFAYWREQLPKRLAIVADDEFHFLVKYATQLQSHVKIGPTGTVAAGPWVEESLPSETLLMAPVIVPPVLDDKVRGKLNGQTKKAVVQGLFSGGERHFQMCGGRSTGMGWVAGRLFSL